LNKRTFLIQAFIRCSLLSGAALFKENTAFIERTTERESTTSFEGPLTWPLVWCVTHRPRPEAEGEVLGTSRRGGTGGQPGQCNKAGASYHGGVGAGWFSQGCARAGSPHGERGGSRDQGWVGGRAGGMNSGSNGGPPPGAVGGFGGGGGGSEDNGASGGGGGYSGGGSGTHPNQAGGGGGSYCSGSSCSGSPGANSNDDGMVQIIELSG